jgi:hypothetical protein
MRINGVQTKFSAMMKVVSPADGNGSDVYHKNSFIDFVDKVDHVD